MEIWKPVVGYENLYEVSNYGRVRSLDRVDCAGRKRKGKELKQRSDKDGYKRAGLSKNGTSKPLLVHRLVAIAFISNPQNKPQINHKDENKANNCVWNLEWCDQAYNNNYGTRNERATKKRIESIKGKYATKGKYTGAKNPRARKVQCINNGMIFDCIIDAREWCGLKGTSDIGQQIKGKQKTAGKDPVTGEKLQWKYID